MTVRHEAEQGMHARDKARCVDPKATDTSRAAAQAAHKAATGKRSSPDPHAGTDRYRLAAPFSFKL